MKESARFPSRRFWCIFVLVLLFIAVFAGCFAIGYFRSLPSDNASGSGRPAAGFTAEDERRIVAEIQQDYSQTILYRTSDASDCITNDQGVSYYNITYMVCSPDSERVDLYVYYKFMTDSDEYKAGDLVCLMHTVLPSLTKSELFPE